MSRIALANYANLTLYVAMVVLALAMLAFAVHVAFAVPRLREKTPVEGREASPGQDARTAERQLATAGAGRAVPGRSILVGDPASDDAEAGVGRRDDGARAAGDGASRERGSRGERLGGAGMTLAWLAAMLLLASVVLRGVAVHRVPVANMFEFAVFGSMLVMFVYLGLAMRWSIRWLGLFVVVPVLLVLGLALTVWYSPAAELLPSLQSLWLAIHVPIATLSVAVFTIAFSVLLLQLAKDRRETQVADDTSEPPRRRSGGAWAVLDSLPSARTLDSLAYGLHIVAFPLWTFSLIAGAIWAQRAWGSYWNWDPKEIWTFVIWVIYAAYLHARATSGWSRRTANTLAVVGYLAIVVNFAIVNVYFVGQHSYSGL
ncbi:MAG: c-type cytochrome biogenesis protein CcsB [Dermatophilaceae bacterium]